jgi:hypothetical protein
MEIESAKESVSISDPGQMIIGPIVVQSEPSRYKELVKKWGDFEISEACGATFASGRVEMLVISNR